MSLDRHRLRREGDLYALLFKARNGSLQVVHSESDVRVAVAQVVQLALVVVVRKLQHRL
jgi:hypothetical protein